ncbi:MAG: hypothetical protein GW906_02555 [Epsilonproteobacteria bacterium]|nr:hypothetical protein [Campylobacterota bacterium]OIO15042.1 MAG: hypothetical protein AUJ81_07915 [Helicobacteraceae bacterium CG1_02_36_14]PIP11102.1 MAG: hypothetical protein COX50_02400 [Sulfurimonas sp. CG23_combo_of_CG06-09_8_20_14_all_36_33]PIS25672.1 MAG: hypothetical protein COT46_05270 [Sulfurimonas sp. CG08_land_8_20_14_0_20_36_33]PIU36138.1 MAG: hypothetical protein COT05_00495 [Sulfurimonas sp. CG07_land_8_20_14_0_80_36_56]PIV04513.1 MAG: hypothetical protein COS56_04635 [Sulfur
MKSVLFLLCFVVFNLFGDPKWIPIEPLDFNEKPKSDTNQTKLKAENQILNNLKIIQRLLNTTRKQDETEADGKD